MSLPFVTTLGNISGDLYARLLKSAYLQIQRVWEPDFSLSREPDIYEKILRDPVIAHATMLRLHNVAGRDWSLEPASDSEQDIRAARVAESLIRRFLTGFSEARYELAQAVFRGRSYAYIEGRRVSVQPQPDFPRADWWVPVRLHDVDKRRIRIKPEWDRMPDGSRKLRTVMEVFSVERDKWEPVRRPEFWITHVYQNEEARLGYGRGLVESIYFYWLLKAELLRRASDAAARFARGVVDIGLDGLRPASDERDNDAIVQKVVEIVDAMLTRGVIVHQREDELRFHEPTATGAQFILGFIQYIDQTIVRLAFGSVLPAGLAEGTGSLARAEVEFDVSESVLQYDRDILDETITRDLVGLFWRLNRRRLSEAGLAGALMPRFRSHRRKSHDPAQMINVIQTALSLGIPLRRDEVYRALGVFTPPKEGDDVISGPPRPTSPMPVGIPPELPVPGQSIQHPPMPLGRSGSAVAADRVHAPAGGSGDSSIDGNGSQPTA